MRVFITQTSHLAMIEAWGRGLALQHKSPDPFGPGFCNVVIAQCLDRLRLHFCSSVKSGRFHSIEPSKLSLPATLGARWRTNTTIPTTKDPRRTKRQGIDRLPDACTVRWFSDSCWLLGRTCRFRFFKLIAPYRYTSKEMNPSALRGFLPRGWRLYDL